MRLSPLLALALAACAAPPPASCPPASPPPTIAPSASAPPPATPSPPRPDVEIEASPVLEPSSALRLSITLRGDAVGTALHIDEASPASLSRLQVTDAEGPLAATVEASGPGLVINLSRPPSPPLSLTYEVAASDPPSGPLSLVVDPNRTRASFERVLALPRQLDAKTVEAELKVTGTTWGPVAFSYGLGATRKVKATGRELRRVSLLAADLGHATFQAYEGHDEMAWFGFTHFDPRYVAAESAAARSAIDQYFGGRTLPFTILLESEKRPDEPLSVSLRAGGVLLLAHLDTPWTSPMRMRLGSVFAQRWVGGRLLVGATEGGPPTWWREGFARAVARDVLFALGSITPDELGDEVHGLLSVAALSAYKGKSSEVLAAMKGDREAAALLTARGALYATRLDALIRARSKQKRSLRELLRGLLKQGGEGAQVSVPEPVFVRAIADELGQAEAGVFERVMREGADVELPADALGPCFRPARVTYESFGLGFDQPRPGAMRVKGLERGSAAEKAGLREGDEIVSIAYEQGRPRSPVKVTVTRDTKARTITYLPIKERRDGPGLARNRKLRDDQCTR